MAKVYVFLADGCEEIEALTPVDLLRRAGIETCTVSIMGRKMIESSHGIRFEADALFEETDFSDGEMFVTPGGMPGSTNLAEYAPLIALLKEKQDEGRHLAAICAAPGVVLGDHGLLEGRKAICFPGFEEHLKGAEVVCRPVVTDQRVTTSRGMGTAVAFGLELVRILAGEETALELKKKIVYGHNC